VLLLVLLLLLPFLQTAGDSRLLQIYLRLLSQQNRTKQAVRQAAQPQSQEEQLTPQVQATHLKPCTKHSVQQLLDTVQTATK
jgi:hypothetical protein